MLANATPFRSEETNRTRMWGAVAGVVALTLLFLLLAGGLVGVVWLTTTTYDTTAGADDRCFNEIGRLDVGIQNFKSTYNMKYIPSRIKLCEKRSYYDTNPASNSNYQLDKDSIAFITTVWNTAGFVNLWTTTGINWSNNPAGLAAKEAEGTWILEGDQCLVFFLGGVQVTEPNGCFGFATGNDPINVSQTSGRKGPFFNFDSARLRTRSGSKFFSYCDPWDVQPYAYFSNYNNGPAGYERYLDDTNRVIDCAGLKVAPYFERTNPNVYQNKTSHQIISAGADTKFGPGATGWTKTTAATMTGDARDDRANFNGGEVLSK